MANCTRERLHSARHRHSGCDLLLAGCVSYRQAEMSDEPLTDWLRERIAAGDIIYIEHRNSMAVYQMLRPVNIDMVRSRL